jgi:hypothetical protein
MKMSRELDRGHHLWPYRRGLVSSPYSDSPTLDARFDNFVSGHDSGPREPQTDQAHTGNLEAGSVDLDMEPELVSMDGYGIELMDVAWPTRKRTLPSLEPTPPTGAR